MTDLFLDANATVPMSPRTIKAYIDFNNSIGGHGHPSSPAAPGRAAALAIETARAKIAELLGAKSAGQIVFTASCTQACEWALKILEAKKPSQLWMSPTEHPAMRLAVDNLAPDYDYLDEMLIDSNGTILHHNYEGWCVICIYVQNEIGIIQPIEKISCEYLVSDMSQAVGKVDNINLSELPVDIGIFGSHKFGGPGNIGYMYLKNPSDWTEFGTGSRYYLDRPGTLDAASIVATAAALEEALETWPARKQNMIEFQTIVEDYFENNNYSVIGKGANRVPNTTFVNLGPNFGYRALLELAEVNTHVALGSACGGANAGQSLLMKKLGPGGNSHDFIRISQFGSYGAKEANFFVNAINKILQKGKTT